MDAELDGAMLLEWIVDETGVDAEQVEAVLYSFTQYMARMGLMEVENRGDGAVDVVFLPPGHHP
jgi:hypothetical protein